MNHTYPLVTIVTVTYNAEKYIEATIKSIFSQNYKNLEYIIIDGKSKDNTVNIIKKFECNISYWISEPDNGIYDAMNKSIVLATGDWIIFMNAGDIFYSESSISDSFNRINIDTDILCGDVFYYNDNNKLILKKAGGGNCLYDGGFNFACHQSLFTRTEILKTNMFSTNFKIISDYAFLLKTYQSGYIFQFIDLPIAIYQNGGFSKRNKILARIEELYLTANNIENIEDIYIKKPYKRLLSYDNYNSNLNFSRLFNRFEKSLQFLNLSNKKFILYGFGSIGQLIFSKYKNNILFIVDKDYQSKKVNYPELHIYSPKKLNNMKSNYILISVLGREKEISEHLESEFNILSHLIIFFTL